VPEPSRGEVWLVDLNPARGHEQAGIRPGLVVSVDPFNHGPAGLVVLLPVLICSVYASYKDIFSAAGAAPAGGGNPFLR